MEINKKIGIKYAPLHLTPVAAPIEIAESQYWLLNKKYAASSTKNIKNISSKATRDITKLRPSKARNAEEKDANKIESKSLRATK